MSEDSQSKLSRRERQIMDAVYRLGRATVSDVIEQISDPPSYSAVRALMNVLEEKGQLRHEQDGPRYVYLPTVARDRARRSALKSLLRTFFDGSSREAIAALLELPDSNLSGSELEELSELIAKAKKEGR
jgi:predicted transcriptional regulator